MMISRVAIAGLVLGLGCLVALGYAARRGPHSGSSAQCRLAIPRSNLDPMVFPSKDGSESLDAAIMSNADDGAIRRVISEQGGFSVPHGTACSELETGPTYARVLIVEGPFAGKTVWAPSSHTRGVTP